MPLLVARLFTHARTLHTLLIYTRIWIYVCSRIYIYFVYTRLLRLFDLLRTAVAVDFCVGFYTTPFTHARWLRLRWFDCGRLRVYVVHCLIALRHSLRWIVDFVYFAFYVVVDYC